MSIENSEELEQSPQIKLETNLNMLENEDGKSNSKTFQKKGKWSPNEDILLKKYVEVYNYKNWKSISQKIPGRSPIQCLHRWTKILQPGLVKGPWTPAEDSKLISWVRYQGPTKWTLCSETIPGRSGKQCREHWNNSLNPQVKKGDWSVQEDLYIMHFYKKFNGSWKKISPFFYKRTENSIKNRFFSQLRKIASQHIFSNEKKFSSKIKLEVLVKYLDEATDQFKERFKNEQNMSSIEEVNEYLKQVEKNYEENEKAKKKENEMMYTKNEFQDIINEPIPNGIPLPINSIEKDNNNLRDPLKLVSLNSNGEEIDYENYDLKQLELEICEKYTKDYLNGINNEDNLESGIDNIIDKEFENKIEITTNKNCCSKCKSEQAFDNNLFFIKKDNASNFLGGDEYSNVSGVNNNPSAKQTNLDEYNMLVVRLLNLEKKLQQTKKDLKTFIQKN